MNLGLEGKYVLVTGGSRGIGFSIAASFKNEGCKVAILSRDPHSEQCTDMFDLVIKCDVGVVEDLKHAIGVIQEAWDGVDIVVNNVGGGGRWGKESIYETEINTWHEVYQKNAMAAVYFTRAFLAEMTKRGWGRVVTISSIYGREGGGRPWFNMAKAAEISLMKCMAQYKDLRGITFNSVAPGYINVRGKPYHDEAGKPEDVADLVTFLCSERASFINGSCIAIDGGEGRSF